MKRYVKTFNPDQIKIYFQDDLLNNPEEVMEDLYQFLQVGTIKLDQINRKYNSFSMPRNQTIHRLYSIYFFRSIVSKILPQTIKKLLSNILFEKKIKPLMSNNTKKYLTDFYRNDIIDLEGLINKDLSNWYKNE